MTDFDDDLDMDAIAHRRWQRTLLDDTCVSARGGLDLSYTAFLQQQDDPEDDADA